MPRAKTPRATTPSNKQVLTMPEVTSTPQIRKASSRQTPKPSTLKAKSASALTSCTRNEDALPARKTKTGFGPNAKFWPVRTTSRARNSRAPSGRAFCPEWENTAFSGDHPVASAGGF